MRRGAFTNSIHPRRLWLYVLVTLVMMFLILPTLIVVPMSFSDGNFLTFPPEEWSLRWYRAYFTSPAWLGATRISMTAAVLTALLATPIGTAAAWGLHRGRFALTPIVLMVLASPMIVPIILIAIGVFFVFARLGLVNTITGLVISHTMMALPFVVILVLARLQSFDMNQVRVAQSLGASPLRAFFTIALPQLRFTLVSAALLAFLTSFDEVIIALFISGGGGATLTKQMFTSLRDQVDPTIAAVSSILIGLSILFVAVLQVLQARAASSHAAPATSRP
jgi:putative spermidine/putrescine transport system permease protein